MSLKAFHIVFISLCILMLFGVLAWAVVNYAREPRPAFLAYAGLSLASGPGLMVYAKYVLKKLKNISYL